jgi:carbon monoxide dehydrogenase subunit G
MPAINKDIIIDATIEDLFSFTFKPSNLPRIWPGLIELKSQKPTPVGGFSYKWTYKMAGRIFSGTGECTDIVQNHWFTAKNAGSIESTITWTFRRKDDKTRVTFTSDYKAPLRLLARMTENTIKTMNEKETELILENLKARFEKK